MFGHTEKPYVVASGKKPYLGDKTDPHVRISYRLPPAVMGRGYIEAIADDEIEGAA